MFSKHYIVFIGFVFSIVFFWMNAVQAKIVISGGKSYAEIIVDSNAPDMVEFAAIELRDHIAMVTGVKIDIHNSPKNIDSIKIFVGDSQYSREVGITTEDLKSDGFRIVSKDNWIAIVGRDHKGLVLHEDINPWRLIEVYNPELKLSALGEAGTLYGVYEFLRETCQIRWYMPGEIGMVVPKKDILSVDDVNIVKSPDFEYRYAWFTFFEKQPEDAKWFRQVGFGGSSPVKITHSFKKFLRFKDTHPEYFALIDGKRDFSNLSTAYPEGNLCLSNPEVALQWVKIICQYFDENPDKKFYGIVPSDGMERICECPKCQSQLNLNSEEAGLFSNYIWSFVNEVAGEVIKKYPEKYVGCIAYEKYTLPPTNIERMCSNVVVLICKTRSKYFDSTLRDDQYNNIFQWSKKTDNLYVWEYYLQSWNPWRYCPTPFTHIISEDIKALKGISKGEFIEAESAEYNENLPCRINFPGMQHLNLYVTARLLWDADINIDILLEEYYKSFYGPASNPMKNFWETAESYWMQQDNVKLRLSVLNDGSPVEVFTPERINTLMRLLKLARKETGHGSIYRRRVDLISEEFSHAVKKLLNERAIRPPEILVEKTNLQVVIDGKLDENLWKIVPPLTFVSRDNGCKASYPSNTYLSWDENYLYVAFENFEPQMEEIQAKAIERDQSASPAVYEDDCIEIFICPNPDSNICYQFIINACGTIWDGAHNYTKGIKLDKDWDCLGMKVACLAKDDRWNLEVKIPLKEIDIKPQLENKIITANFYRSRVCGSSNRVFSCWSPPLRVSHFAPERFGKVNLKGK